MTWLVADASAAPPCARCGRRHGYDPCRAGDASGRSRRPGPDRTGRHAIYQTTGGLSPVVSGNYSPVHWTAQLSGWSTGVAHPGQVAGTPHEPPAERDARSVFDTTYGVGGATDWDPTPDVLSHPDDRRPARAEQSWPSVTTNPLGHDALGVARRAERRERTRTAQFGFPLQTHTPRRARRHTVEFARRWGLDDLVEAAELLVSELMTNALEASYLSLGRHGASRMVAPLELRLSAERRQLRIEVRDHNPQPPVLDEPTLDDTRGRGLLLVDSYAEFWGYHRLPTGGKVVWCVIGPPSDDA